MKLIIRILLILCVALPLHADEPTLIPPKVNQVIGILQKFEGRPVNKAIEEIRKIYPETKDVTEVVGSAIGHGNISIELGNGLSIGVNVLDKGKKGVRTMDNWVLGGSTIPGNVTEFRIADHRNKTNVITITVRPFPAK